MKFVFVFFLLATCSIVAIGQPQAYNLINAHSHNDYLQSKPLISAFEAGFGSVEADIFPVDGDLLVAHTDKELAKARTLQTLYLHPLKSILKNRAEELQLLIDIKTDTKTVMDLLIKQLKPLRKHLSTQTKKGKLKIVMTGKIPSPEDWASYPDYIFYDNNLSQDLSAQQWQRVGMVSVNFKSYSTWKGKGALAKAGLTTLKQLISQAHDKDKPFRFWGAPDQAESWNLQMQIGADWIGTDHIDQLRAFLTSRK